MRLNWNKEYDSIAIAMKFASSQFTFRVIFESDEGGYHASVPALSGCHTWGKNLEEVRENVREAIRAHVGSLIKDGEKVPTDLGFESLETISSNELQLTPA